MFLYVTVWTEQKLQQYNIDAVKKVILLKAVKVVSKAMQ